MAPSAAISSVFFRSSGGSYMSSKEEKRRLRLKRQSPKSAQPEENVHPGSDEDSYYTHHPDDPLDNSTKEVHEDDNDHDPHSHQHSQEYSNQKDSVLNRDSREQVTPQYRRPRNNNPTNTTDSIPEVKYSKGEIISPIKVITDKRVEAPPPPGPGDPKATGQYQQHSGYISNGGPRNGISPNYNGNGNNGGPTFTYNGHIHQPLSPQPPYGFQPHYPQTNFPPNYIYDSNTQMYYNITSDGVNVRGEEVGIVVVVLMLWIGAIILFFNRWGKIRMLEPYQPKFCENHRPSCPMAEVTAISNHPVCHDRAYSKFNLSTEMLAGSPHFVKCNYHGVPSNDPTPGFSGLTIPAHRFASGGSTGMLSNHNAMMMNHRPRQNSVFVTSPVSQVSFYGSDTALKNTSRKTKSAVDLPTLVLTGDFIDNVRRNSKNSITQL